MLMRGRFFLNRRLGLEQAKYGTYLCQCFILSFGTFIKKIVAEEILKK